MSDTAGPVKRKLIEVALPLEAINRESVREKAIRHGHPSTLHLWWSRKPLAAARAVLFAQLVDDPSAHPDRFPSDEDQARERRRLFDLIEKLAVWDNVTNETLLNQAYDEIAKSFDGKPPSISDPFAGGGSIPLEAQRLGLEAHASDLNPVAVLINKALIEIPPMWAGRPPVFPGAADSRLGNWPHGTGLAEDVRRYGQWIRDEAEKRIGHLYPKATLPDGSGASVIAWIWARTVPCPNPACGATMPLPSTLWLANKKDRPTWLKPVVLGNQITFEVVVDKSGPPQGPKRGRGANFVCLACGTPAHRDFVHDQFRAGRDGLQLLSTVVSYGRRKTYLPASPEQIAAAQVTRPLDVPDQECRGTFGSNAQGRPYGFRTYADYFTNRQLAALETLSELVGEVQGEATRDAIGSGLSDAESELRGKAVATYLALALGRVVDYNSSLCTWISGRETIRNTFARQAISMSWESVEANLLGEATGNWLGQVRWVSDAITHLPRARHTGLAKQKSAQVVSHSTAAVSTDPPYYNNVSYADLADFFYVWLRRSLRDVYPDLLDTLLTPKTDELVAAPQRFDGSQARADDHFESGFIDVFSALRESHPTDVPLTVFYAFKQAESDEEGVASTGWETMLEGLVKSGLAVTATWPMRTELTSRVVSSGKNALASSIVLACRSRREEAESTNRRGFIAALKRELPSALRELQQGSVAPVDLAQAAIGPGMAVFSRYSRVVEADGTDMSVRTALALINQVLDEVLSEQEGDFDSDTRFCLKWFSQFGWNEQPYGRADELTRSTNTSVDGLVRGGAFWARAGKARLLEPSELTDGWDPATDDRISVWEVVLRLAKALNDTGAHDAARLMAAAGQRIDLDAAKELAYLLFSICEKHGWTQTALLFNGLGTSWSDLSAAAHTGGSLTPPPAQGEFDFNHGEE